jgi:hypothetical protein
MSGAGKKVAINFKQAVHRHQGKKAQLIDGG